MDIQLESLRVALADKMGSVLTPELAASIIFLASNGNAPTKAVSVAPNTNNNK